MRRLTAGLVLVSLLASACTAGTPDEPEVVAVEPAEGFQRLTAEHCTELSLGASSGVPWDEIAVEGWPGLPSEDWGLTAAAVAPSDGDLPGWEDASTVVSTWRHPATVSVPVHPSEDPDGGTITLRFGQIDHDGNDLWCDETHELRIEPLPRAEQEDGLAAHLSVLEERFELIAELLETSVPELLELEPGEIPHDLLPLVIGVRLLHDDDALPAQVEAMSPTERDLADRLFAHASSVDVTRGAELPLEAPELQQGSAAGVDGTALAPDRALDGAVIVPTVAQGANPTSRPPVPGGAVHASPVNAGAAACASVDLDGLARLMGHQFSGETMLSGAPGGLIDFAMFAGGLPYIGRWALPTVLTAWLTKVTSQYLDGMLPSQWSPSTIDYAPRELWEDDVDGGVFEGLTMRFSSKGWDAGPVLAELAMIVLEQGMSSALQRYLKPVPTEGALGTTEILGEVVWENIAAQQRAEAVTELVAEVYAWVIADVLSDLIDDSGLAQGLLTYDPRCWNAETRRPDLHGSLELTFLDAIEQGVAFEAYRAATVGTGTIEASWELPIGRHVLGPVSSAVRDTAIPFGAKVAVEVRPIEVTWSPSRQQVRPGDVVTLQVNVANAHDGRVRITDTLGQLDTEVDAAQAAGGSTVTYRVPADWDGTLIEVRATSLSSRGLRAPSHPAFRGEVTGTARLSAELEGLFIEPAVSCLEPGASVRFEALDAPLDGDPVDVTWEADGGSISADGRFQAPSERATVTVTAHHPEDEELTTSLTLEVGSCDECSWSVSLGGLLGGQGGAAASGSWIELTGVDWATREYTGLTLYLDHDEDGGPAEMVRLTAADGRASTRPSPLDVPYLDDDRTSWLATFYEDVPAVPDRRLEPLAYQRLWSGSGDLGLGHGIPLTVVDWDPPSISASIDVSQDADGGRPSIHLRGTASGDLLVGRVFVDTVDGMPVAMSAGMIAEPMYGSIEVTFSGRFLPPLNLEPELDILRGFGSDGGSDGSGAGAGGDVPVGWGFDLDADTAWCGGPFSRDPRLERR